MKLQTKGYYTARILFLPLNNDLITVNAYSVGVVKTIINRVRKSVPDPGSVYFIQERCTKNLNGNK